MENFNAESYLDELEILTKDMTDEDRQLFIEKDLDKLSDEEYSEVMDILKCEDDDKSELSTDDMFDKLSLGMEIERMDNFEKEVVVSDDVIESELYTEAMAECEVFVAMIKKMNKQGIDLQSCGAIAQNYITHKQRLRELEYQVRVQGI